MIHIDGYSLTECIHKGNTSVIYRGIQQSDGRKVAIKLSKSEYPSLIELENLRREFTLGRKPYGDGVVQALSLKPVGNGLALVMDDFGGITLSQNNNSLDLPGKILLALRLCQGLHQIHAQGVIHQNLNPTNILCTKDFKIIKIIDFSKAAESAIARSQNQDTLEGLVYYVSPEQTGKIRRAVDFRSDLYSLGIILYELFSGVLPFSGDILETIYAHIAKKPMELRGLNIELPSLLSDIIMKLLQKDPGKRYQTALGLLEDLQYCFDKLQTPEKLINYELGKKDRSEEFIIPQKLYGRENELCSLQKAVDELGTSQTKFILVSGYSGVGKSSIINETSRFILEKGGRFISGKYNPLEHNIPYSAMISAFRLLVRTVIAETEDIGTLKQTLLTNLGVNAPVIGDLIPELKGIIGSHGKAQILDPTEQRYRFLLAFLDFLRCFTSQDRPLILFLDDLQWCDLSSFDLLKYLLSARDLKNLLIIGAYRDNELDIQHPLHYLLEELRNLGREENFLQRIMLRPLEEKHIKLLVEDTLSLIPEETVKLTNYLYSKTKGNPFFTNQLLKSLHEKKVLFFDREKNHWRCDLHGLAQAQIHTDVIPFLLENLSLLPESALELLKTAACIGDRFDLKMLYTLDIPTGAIPTSLRILMEKGYVLPIYNAYRYLDIQKKKFLHSKLRAEFIFSHDHIHQAVYSMVTKQEKMVCHGKIGRALLAGLKEAEDTAIFEVAKQLNLAREAIRTRKEKIRLLDLNIRAGKQAKENTAYNIAQAYFTIATELLTEKEWETHKDTLFELSLDHTESLFLSGKDDRLLERCDKLNELAATKENKARVCALKVKILDQRGEKCSIILREIRTVLSLYDIRLPEDSEETKKLVNQGLERMKTSLTKHSITELVKLPLLDAAEDIMVMNLYFQALSPAYQSNLPLYLFIQLSMFEMSMAKGITAVSCKNFTECGLSLGSLLGDFQGGYRFGQVAFSLIETHGFHAQKAPCSFIFATFLSHWVSHFNESLEYFDLAIQSGLEWGDIQHASYSHAHRISRLLYTGMNLEELKLELDKTEHFLHSHTALLLLIYTEYFRMFIRQLQKPYDVDLGKKLLEQTLAGDNLFNLCVLGQMNLMIHYILGNFMEAEKWLAFTEPYLTEVIGLFSMVDHQMFRTLIDLRKYAADTDRKDESLLAKIEGGIEKIKTWADNCPENFAHKYYLVRAEQAKVLEEGMETITDFYRKALRAIRPGEFTHMKALISEAIGEYWLSQKDEIIAKAYIREAWHGYDQWGAYAKTDSLGKKYPYWLSEIHTKDQRTSKQNPVQGSILDVLSLVKASQAISEKIQLDQLLIRFMKILMENVGARNGCLMLKDTVSDKLFIRAMKEETTAEFRYMEGLELSKCHCHCPEIVKGVFQTQVPIVLENASKNPDYTQNVYIKDKGIKSILCTPIIHKGGLKGILYLENNLAEGVFSMDHLRISELLASQMAISIENTQFYEKMDILVRERTSELNRLNRELEELTLHDPLTKLHNRRFVYEYVTEACENFKKAKAAVYFNRQKRNIMVDKYVMGVFLVDLDNFKGVNDSYGHAAGDQVLLTYTKLLQNLIREDDYLVRWGGEEFLIILNNSTIEYLETFSKKVLQTMKNTLIVLPEDRSIRQLCSMGCAYLPFAPNLPELLSLEQTIQLCDHALYLAKDHGKACSVHLSLNKGIEISLESLKNKLVTLTKETMMDSAYIKVRYIRGDDKN